MATIRASGSAPSSAALRLGGEHEAGGAVVERRGVAGGDGAALAERRVAARPASRAWCRRAGPRRASTYASSPRFAAGASTATSSLGERPSRLGGDRALVAAQRERVLVGARDPVALGDVLGRLAHRLGRVALGHPRVDQAPAERRVVQRLLAARAARSRASAITHGARLIDSEPPAR